MAAPALPNRYDQPELVAVIKATVCKGANDAQLRMFLEVCRSTGLDPFLKEIYFVPDKNLIMAARDGYLRVANEHPQFDGMETRVERDANNVPVKATCSVWRKDRAHAITCEAYYSEYRKSGPVWAQYPSAMISKVAEVLALKRSFAINGVVTEEELSTGEPRSKVEVMRKPPQPAVAIAEQIPEAHDEQVYYEEVELPDDERTQLEAELEASIAAAEAKKPMLEAFARLKERYLAIGGLKTYYAVLGLHGVSRPEAFATPEAGRACYVDMRDDIKTREARRAV